MVILLNKRIMVGVILTIIVLQTVHAQFNKEYPTLKNYGKFSFVAGPVVYDRATLIKKYGNYTFENLPIFSFNAGFEYDFHPDKKWAVTTGFYTVLEPICRIRLHIKEADLFANWVEEDLVEVYSQYSMCSFSTPLLIRYNLQTGKNTFVNFSTGIKGMYFPEGDAELTQSMTCEDQMETREIFGLRARSPEQEYHGSFVIGTGYAIATKKLLLKSNLLYVMNFQNLMKGEYLYGNLEQSGDSRGSYKLSGNYLGLLFSVGFKKKQDY